MSDQTIPLRYEAVYKDGATAAMERTIAAAQKLDDKIAAVARTSAAGARGGVAALTTSFDELSQAAGRSANAAQTSLQRAAAATGSIADRMRAQAGQVSEAWKRVEIVDPFRDVPDAAAAAETATTRAAQSLRTAGTAAEAAAPRTAKLGAALGLAGSAAHAMGVQGAGALATMTGRVVQLADGAGPAAAVVGTLAAAVFAVNKAAEFGKSHLAEWNEQVAAMARVSGPAAEVVARAGEAARARRLATTAAAAGRSVDLQTLEAERRRLEGEVTFNSNVIGNLQRRGVGAGIEPGKLWDALDFTGDLAKLETAQRALRDAQDGLRDVERAITETKQEESSKRAEAARAEAEAQRRASDAIAASLRAQGAAEVATAREALQASRDAASMDRFDAQLAARRRRLDAESAVIAAGEGNEGARAERVRALGEAYALDVKRIEEERQRVWLEEFDRAQREKEEAEARESAAKLRADEQAAERAAEQARRAAERQAQLAEQYQERVLDATRQLHFDLAQEGRSETERAVAEAQERYAGLIEEARQHGQSTVALEEALAARIASIRARAAAAPVVVRAEAAGLPAAPTFQQATQQHAAEIVERVQSPANLAATAVNSLGSAFQRLGDNAMSGTMRAADAMRRFASDFVGSLRQIAAQQFAAQLIGSIFGAAAAPLPAPPIPSPGGPVQAPSGAFFAAGGVSAVPAIFGERGPEAAVPLSHGRRIPVELRGRADGGRSEVHVHHHHTWHVQALDPRGVAAVLAQSQDVVATLTAESLGRHAGLRRAVQQAARS